MRVHGFLIFVKAQVLRNTLMEIHMKVFSSKADLMGKVFSDG
jgi:hypothetical protein